MVTEESKLRLFVFVLSCDIKHEQMNKAEDEIFPLLIQGRDNLKQQPALLAVLKKHKLNSPFLVFLFVPYPNALKAITDRHL